MTELIRRCSVHKKLKYLVPIIFVFFGCEAKNTSIPVVAVKTKIEINDSTFTEGAANYASLNVSLTGMPITPIYVEYETVPATAGQGEDFETTSGILVFSGEEASHSQNIFIEIMDDDKYEEEEFFEIHFTADTLVYLNNEKVKITILDNDVQLTDNDFPGYATPMEYKGWNFFWADEFGGNELNLENWTQANRGNWYNNELQYYKPENTGVENGLLTITAKPELIYNHNYSSSRIWSEHNVFFKYGRIDIRAKLPFSQGLWPALWMMGENKDEVGWPECGEIDIMELRGAIPNVVGATVHYRNAAGNHQYVVTNKYTLSNGDFSDEFHVFTMIWDEHKIKFFVDDNPYVTIFFSSLNFNNNNNPFLKDFFILMNVAVGGNYGGNPDATTIWPQKMEVDYVRIFQKK